METSRDETGTTSTVKIFHSKSWRDRNSERNRGSDFNRPASGSVPYKDHILALHLTDLTVEGREENPGLEAIVYAESMRDNILTAAARFRPGDRVTLRLRSWADVSDKYEKINRSEIDDPAVQLEEPCWGEITR